MIGNVSVLPAMPPIIMLGPHRAPGDRIGIAHQSDRSIRLHIHQQFNTLTWTQPHAALGH
jgi:hypothetical protein